MKFYVDGISLDEAGQVAIDGPELEALSHLAGGRWDPDASAINSGTRCRNSTNAIGCQNTQVCDGSTNKLGCTNSEICRK